MTQEYDESGKRITFFPDSLMMALNPRPLIFFNDTKNNAIIMLTWNFCLYTLFK